MCVCVCVVVMMPLIENSPHQPLIGQITEARSNIVSNNTLAHVMVEHTIHPYMMYDQIALDLVVDAIENIQKTTSSYSQQLEVSGCVFTSSLASSDHRTFSFNFGHQAHARRLSI